MLDFTSSITLKNSSTKTSSEIAEPFGLYSRAGKRVFDIVLAILLLPAVIPVVLVLWCLVRQDGGPGFFGHTRVGKDAKPFKCWKIRSMVVDAESRLQSYLDAHPEAAAEWDRDHKLIHDPRINQLGRLLRETSLDELPQIWNVLKGEMSFVGPRPVVATELVKYGSSASAYLVQKPGITGLWQVSGRNEVTYGERVAMDVDYLTQRNFVMDLKIIVRTFHILVLRTGR
ncbi:sugar transferase [Ruegeria atlantica]|uniref:sugar transferase n=1 Tax=Ruegeria atlantica TaxID=81569 RepID=UPI00147EBADC